MLKHGTGATIVRSLGGLGLTVLLPQACCAADWGVRLLAQAQGGPAAPRVLVAEKSYVLEGLVVAVLFAAAIFAVCRSSRRN